MFSAYGLNIIENCQSCQMQPERPFCDLSPTAIEAFEAIKYTNAYPAGAVLFVEGQMPSGIFVLCNGRVKMSASTADGKTLTVRIAQPGEVLGLSATLSGKAYELSAEAAEPCQITFVERNEYLRFLREYPDACFKVAQQLSEKYRTACNEVRTLGLARTADRKLAKLLLQWMHEKSEISDQDCYLELPLGQEEIGHLIGSTRETVTRVFAEFRKQRIVDGTGSRLVIRNVNKLTDIAAAN
jgi:CRP/FNR family transcriptional regulator, cyclic AMP receptor protein